MECEKNDLIICGSSSETSELNQGNSTACVYKLVHSDTYVQTDFITHLTGIKPMFVILDIGHNTSCLKHPSTQDIYFQDNHVKCNYLRHLVSIC